METVIEKSDVTGLDKDEADKVIRFIGHLAQTVLSAVEHGGIKPEIAMGSLALAMKMTGKIFIDEGKIAIRENELDDFILGLVENADAEIIQKETVQ